MKRYQFKLQKLLDIRETREKEVKNELAALLNIQNAERMKQEEYRRKIAVEREKFTFKLKSGKFTYSESAMFERYVDFANKVIDAAQDRIDSMEGEISRVRLKLVEASREKKVVERLKERQWEEYQYEVNREIAKENDDANQKLYVRKMLQSMQ
ncbi:MAG TPA: flagellar export protein FliJ [Spirochaetota bacterium]|nr:flagellar export protein FliJ [Spirochaetota bacterium]HQP47487.1 flagellar export protein FliJ [Spirochaetota bacterium]